MSSIASGILHHAGRGCATWAPPLIMIWAPDLGITPVCFHTKHHCNTHTHTHTHTYTHALHPWRLLSSIGGCASISSIF